MDLLQLGFHHFDDAADTQQGLFGAADTHFAPLDAAPVAATADDLASISGSMGSSSRCGSPAPFESLPRFDEPASNLRFAADEAKYDAADLHAAPGPKAAPAASRFGLSIMLPPTEDVYAAAIPRATPVQAAPAAIASVSPAAVVTAPRSVARRVRQVRPGTRVHRAAVADAAPVVAASAVGGAVFAAAVVDDRFRGPALPARVFSSEPAESVVSDDSSSSSFAAGGRPRLASISTASTPGSPVSASVVHSSPVPARPARFFASSPSSSRAASPVASLLGKRKAAVVAAAMPANKRARASYSNAAAMPASRLVLVRRSEARAGAAARTFVVVGGAAGRISTVTVGVEPSCTCSSFAGGRLCEHLVFVFVRVLKVPLGSPLLSRTRLSSAEIAAVFAAAPAAPAAPVASASSSSSAGNGNGRGPAAGRRRSSLVVRQGTDGRECSLCCESFAADSLSYCMSGCGTNFHQECLARYHAYQARATTVVAAKVVSASSAQQQKRQTASAAAAAASQGPARRAQALGSEPSCCPVCHAHWKDEDDHLDVNSPPARMDDMDELGYDSPLNGASTTFFDSLDFSSDSLLVL